MAEIHPMHPRIPLLLLALLLTVTLLAGCGGQTSPGSPETPPATTAVPTTLPATAPPVPQATAPPEPFPGALSIGTPYRYGREDIAMEVTVYGVKAVEGYEWWSPNWGRYWNTTPDEGDHFLIALVRFIDRGTARARLPSQGMFVLHGEGNSYVQNVERDHSLWIRGIDVKQYDSYYDDRAGWIDPGESNGVEGFLLYEVPASLTPGNTYLQVTFSSQAAAVWKLG
jgi:hypothetical protein